MNYLDDPEPLCYFGGGHVCKSTLCDTCDEIMYWIDCPTGGWWKHVDHPEDDHEGTAPIPAHSGEDYD